MSCNSSRHFENLEKGEDMKRRLDQHAIILFALIVICFSIGLSGAYAADRQWPSKAVTINAGFGPGGTTDLTNRIVSNILGGQLGVPIINGNVTGGATSVLCSQIATKKPDGYEFGLVAGTALTAMPFMRDLAYNIDSFTYVFMLAPDPLDLVVTDDSPFKTFEDLVSYAKTNPGKVTYSHTGKGLYDHLVVEWIAQKEGIQLTDVPATSGPESMALVIGKHVAFGSGSGSHIPYAKDGKMRVLLEMDGARRWGDKVRNVVDLYGTESPVNTYRVFVGPQGISQDIVDKMKQALLVAVKEEVYIKLCDRFNMSTDYYSENIKELLQKQYNEMGPFLEKIGLGKK